VTAHSLRAGLLRLASPPLRVKLAQVAQVWGRLGVKSRRSCLAKVSSLPGGVPSSPGQMDPTRPQLGHWLEDREDLGASAVGPAMARKKKGSGP
jgi:hypothetical protein